jgi:tetratricopeptide (TPR) repeat protein
MRDDVTRLFGIALTAALASGCAGPAAAPAVKTEEPRACAAALASGPESSPRDRQIARLQAEARGAARASQALERLGYLYVARARVSNDPGDYKLAEMAAECLAAKDPAEPAALLLRGHVLHQLHRFREAEEIARALVARRTVVLDYGLLGDALMEQGRLTEAAAAYQKMLDLKPFYQSYTRAAHLRWLKGDLDGAMAAMQLAIDAASPRDPESSAWAWTRMSAYALQAGRPVEASNAADKALAAQPSYAAALLARGRAFLAVQRTPDAIVAFRRAATLNPLPEYQWILADALRLVGDDAAAAEVEREIAGRGTGTDPRTVSLFLATRRADPAKALALAEEELRARGDIFTLDAHAWALAGAGRLDDARRTIMRAVAEGTNDARLFLHAGAILAASGDVTAAAPWLRKADRLKSMLLPSESAELRAQLARIASPQARRRI